MARKTPRVSEREALKQQLLATGNADIKRLVEKKRLRTLGEVMDALQFLTPNFIAKRFSERHLEFFEALRSVYKKHVGVWYEPEGFFHPSFPPEAQEELARIYHYPARLKSAALNPHTPRSHLYAAWKLGLITEEEMRSAPPMYRRQSFLRRRKSKKALR